MMVFWTILAGVSVYVIGQIALKFLVDPLHAQSETIGKVIDFLIQHQTRYSYPGTEANNPMIKKAGIPVEEWGQQLERTKHRARELASELLVRTHTIPLYQLFVWLRLARPRADIRAAHDALRSLSLSLVNVSVFGGNANRALAETIKNALDIEPEFQIEARNEADAEATRE